VKLSVSDTGIGIPPDQLDKVFDRFYQVDASQTREQEGSGLGLALVKELVELHHGTICVQSEIGRGTTFTVRLPLGRDHLRDDEIVEAPASVEPTMREVEGVAAQKDVGAAPEVTESEQPKSDKPIVLVVEDNADVRTYIRGYLVPVYQVTEARDGAEGIEKALEMIPDLIISDVMMPKKDGYEVCRTLKLDEKTSHIPIILLTAKAASENKIEGLDIGADDYLIKPFEPNELLARAKNLIDLRRKLRERFKVSVPLKPGEVAVTSMDDAFLQKVMSTVETRIGDEKFSVEELAKEVCMSRVQLHRKLIALTNQPPGEFIRYIRLHRAMDLLRKNAGTVAEIAYSVGYGDPSHFSTKFREQFGLTPGDVRKNPDGAASKS
jgi:DNA-binding response OmpR family regulator